MSIETDLSLWEQLAKWAWALLVFPFGWLWRKAEGAVSKEDFQTHVKDDKDAHKEQRESMEKLFTNAESDRKLVRDGFDKLGETIHESHLSLIKRMDDIR